MNKFCMNDRNFLTSHTIFFIKKLVINSVKSYKCVNIVIDEIGGKV